MVNQLAVRLGTDLNAGVAFYGRQAAVEDVPKISAPVLLHYAGRFCRLRRGCLLPIGICVIDARRQLADWESDLIFWFAWSPDRKQLACVRGTNAKVLILMADLNLVQ
jgi:hypothetical protein